MSERHVPVWELEPGDPVDEAHLRECAECRRSWEALQFLRHEAACAPEPEAAPFFAARVARIAFSEGANPWALLERAARRWAPLFASLALAALLIMLVWPPPQPPADYAELLVESEVDEGELSLDDVLYGLGLPLEEESAVEN